MAYRGTEVPERQGSDKSRLQEKAREQFIEWLKEVDVSVVKLRQTSDERPLRIVIDEVLPQEIYRVLSAERSPDPRTADDLDPGSWGPEKEHYMTKDQVLSLLSPAQQGELWEGRVFLLRKKESESIYQDVRSHVKDRTNRLLRREGRIGEGFEGRRR